MPKTFTQTLMNQLCSQRKVMAFEDEIKAADAICNNCESKGKADHVLGVQDLPLSPLSN